MPKTLTKADIVDAVQKENGYSLTKSTHIVEVLMNIIRDTLESGEDVLISGFGKFQTRDKQARKGRNPATGEDMILAARRVVSFKCSGRLRDLINRK